MNRIIAFAAARAAVAFSLLSPPASAFAAGGHDHGMHGIGEAGRAADVTRTVEVAMYDNYYVPEELSLREGETVRFVVVNEGALVHEFAIATAEMHLAHLPEMEALVKHGVLERHRINWEAAEAMRMTTGEGMHDEGNSILLEPGQTGELIWAFPEHSDLEFACNIPGHYEMTGKINLTH